MTTTDEDENVDVPKPLKISCTWSECEDNLHCFRATQKLRKDNKAGACRACGVELIDWDRVHACNLDDVEHTFDELRRELVRHHFFHVDIDQKARNHARRKGRRALYADAHRRLQRYVGREPDAYDGRQTPFEGNTIYYAQHATAACCRKCIEYWHGFPIEGELAPVQLDYLYQLVVRYLDERLPDLGDEPENVPRRRS